MTPKEKATRLHQTILLVYNDKHCSDEKGYDSDMSHVNRIMDAVIKFFMDQMPNYEVPDGIIACGQENRSSFHEYLNSMMIDFYDPKV